MDRKGSREAAVDGVSQALALLQADEIDREKLTFLLRGLQDKLIATGEHLQQASDGAQCGTDRPEHIGRAVQKVFDVPELLELILLNLHVIDLLTLQQVNRQVRDAINTSKKVQQRMFLIPSGNAHRRVLPAFPLKNSYRSPVKDSLETPILLDLKLHCLPASQGYKATMQLSARTSGLRYRRHYLQMQLTDPPVRRLSVECSCSCIPPARPFNIAFDGYPGVIINEKDGITLGRLRDAFKQVAEEHKTCPHAQPQYHSRNGNVILEYTAVGDLYMDRDDPLALLLRDEEYKAWNKMRKMEEFCQAKQNAASLNKEIPTLAEFKADQAAMARRTRKNKP
ncbi:hypothetical protein KC360_g3459 [Hortaea werneckii]|nr:hypothetical protein KC361_g3560 [Hortaea werneckii]KAI6885764.1 hypothetical protein KC325_g3361 [Hortaea werneckii]KAI6995156.1 hypothetical protein KC359_g4257 [Hortaea werneckii]KAI7147166.1 hypothetical protein KC344_g3034 [Hortaea werneckii]KAI7175791.1 hypothetical protein KC360_g3459 [Hortaea werneckii]